MTAKKIQEMEFLIDKDNILNSNRQLHRYLKAQRVKFLRTLSREHGITIREKGLLDGPFSTFKVTAYVSPPTRAQVDPPNLYPTIKPLIDGLTDAEWWIDDNYQFLVEMAFKYGGLSGEKGHYKIKLVVEEVDDPSIYVTKV